MGLPDLVEEDGPAVRHLEQTLLVRVGAGERRFIEHVAVLLGLAPFVSGFEFGMGADSARPAPDRRVDEALATLGLARGASAEEIKRAWRRLSLENHPDRVTHLGEEFRQLAEERMRAINAAYDVLKEAGLAS